MLEIQAALEIFAAVIVFAGIIVWLQHRYSPIVSSARRMKLRDKGETQSDEDIEWVHDRCGTRTRIGIDKYGQAHEYCWRCEELITSEVASDEANTVVPIKDGNDSVVHQADEYAV